MTTDLAWYAHRLRAMSPAELGHRVVERGLRIGARRRDWTTAFAPPPGPLPAIPVGRDALRRVDPEVVEGWRRLRDDLAAGRLTLLDATWPTVGGRIPWHRDPVTGADWPSDAYCFDVPYRGGTGLGDVKYVWEINRLQVAPLLAALAVLDGDEDLRTTCWSLIESWIDANPPFRGVAWASGIELALRTVSILLVLGLLGAETVPAGLAGKLGTCLSAQAFWLARYPSRHSSANNHLIAEAAGLFLLGTLWAGHPEARRYAAQGRGVLTAEAARQIHPDGIGAEQSPTYTALTCEWYLLAMAVARRAGTPFPAAVSERIALAAEALRWFTDGSGDLPRIGDDDDSHVIASEAGHEARYVASLIGAAAAAGRPDLAPPGMRIGLRGAVLGAPDEPAAAPRGTRTFAAGGYTVHRGRMAARDVLLAFDHGPLGHLSIAAHGHADALSLWLHVDGEPVLVDAGTYLYHAADGWRDRFRGTAAHNTLLLGGVDQTLPAGPFNWRRAARAAVLRTSGDGLDVEAEHDGYRRRFGVLCRRRVRADAGGFDVVDRLVEVAGRHGQARPSVEIGFLLASGLDATSDGRAVTVSRDGRLVLRLTAATPMRPRLGEAAVSPRFGTKLSTVRIVFVPESDTALAFGLRFDVLPATARGAVRHADALACETTP